VRLEWLSGPVSSFRFLGPKSKCPGVFGRLFIKISPTDSLSRTGPGWRLQRNRPERWDNSVLRHGRVGKKYQEQGGYFLHLSRFTRRRARLSILTGLRRVLRFCIYQPSAPEFRSRLSTWVQGLLDTRRLFSPGQVIRSEASRISPNQDPYCRDGRRTGLVKPGDTGRTVLLNRKRQCIR
jgi:hypothetical protein